LVVYFVHRTDKDGSSLFWWQVAATHYRRDRLRVWAYESPVTECSDRLLAWLMRFWTDEEGNGVIKLDADKTPPIEPIDGMEGRPLDPENAWLMAQLAAGRKLSDCRDEWKRRYREAKPNNATTPDRAWKGVRQRMIRKGYE
jgi:hypothetical protein